MSNNTNFATWNPLTMGSRASLAEGNLTMKGTSVDLCGVTSTMGITSGKWYWEIYIARGHSTYMYAGLSSGFEGAGQYAAPYFNLNGMIPGAIRIKHDGTLHDSSSSDDPDRWGTITLTSTGVQSWDDTDILMLALDFDNKKLWFGKNGTFMNSGNPASGSNEQASWSGDIPIIYPSAEPYYTNNNMTVNFGQDSSFVNRKTSGSAAATDGNGYGDFYYTPPTGYLALCSANLPTSDDINPAETDDDYPGKQFGAEVFTGNAGTQTIQLGDSFKPDCVWMKNRGTSNSWIVIDSSRGYNKTLKLEDNSAESTDAYVGYGIESDFFDSTGIKANSGGSPGFNASSGEYIVYGWRANGGTTSTNNEGNHTCTLQANAKAGFSIMTLGNYTSASGVTIGHGLDKAPSFYIHKPLNSNNWHVYHSSLGATKALLMNSYNAAATAVGYWANTEPTADVLSLGNTFAGTFDGIVYAWAEVDGYSKFGAFEGSGNVAGAFVYTGFRPRMLFVKDADRGEYLQVFDTARNTFNPVDKGISWNDNGAESTGSGSGFDVDFLSNGFKMRCTHDNLNGTSMYVYGAWGDVPTKFSNTF